MTTYYVLAVTRSIDDDGKRRGPRELRFIGRGIRASQANARADRAAALLKARRKRARLAAKLAAQTHENGRPTPLCGKSPQRP